MPKLWCKITFWHRLSQNTAPAAPSAPAPKKVYFESIGRFSWISWIDIGRFSWISWIDRWHSDSQQCFEPWLQTAPAKAAGSRQDYHDFEAPLLTTLLVLASQATTDCATKTFLFQYSKYTYFRGPCRWCGRCGVSWHHSDISYFAISLFDNLLSPHFLKTPLAFSYTLVYTE